MTINSILLLWSIIIRILFMNTRYIIYVHSLYYLCIVDDLYRISEVVAAAQQQQMNIFASIIGSLFSMLSLILLPTHPGTHSIYAFLTFYALFGVHYFRAGCYKGCLISEKQLSTSELLSTPAYFIFSRFSFWSWMPIQVQCDAARKLLRVGLVCARRTAMQAQNSNWRRTEVFRIGWLLLVLLYTACWAAVLYWSFSFFLSRLRFIFVIYFSFSPPL